MKKVATAILSLFLMLVIALPCFADEGPGIILTADKTSVKAGETVKFTVSLSDSVNTKSGSIELSFPENFELVSAGWTLTGTSMANYDASKNKGAFMFASATFIGDEESGFVIFEFTLKAKTAASTAQSVKASVQFKNGSIVVGESNSTASVKIACVTHSYGDYTQTKAPTCTAKGEKTRTCGACGAVDKQEIAALGHDYGDWTETKAPTCTAKGTETRTCSRCKTTENRDIAALSHDYGDWIQTKAPTCTVKGEETRTCKHDESHKETREINALGHDWGAWTQTKAPTCTQKGEETRTCKNDANHKETRDVAMVAHDYGEWVVTKKPTCTEKGEETRACKNCEHKETRDVAATGHSFADPVVTKEPTCTEAGESTGTCTVCGKTTTQAIKATGHDWGAWTTTTEATCEKKGEQTRVCKHDESHTEKRSVAALGHDFEEPKIVKEATLTETGLMQGKCKRCGKTADQVIPCKAADTETGVVIESEKPVFDKGAELKVDVLDAGSAEAEAVMDAIKDVSGRATAYSINAVVGETVVQPNGKVSLTLSLSGYGSNAAAYIIAPDGTAKKLDYVINDNNTMTVETEVLGTIAVVDLSAKGDDNSSTASSEPDSSAVEPSSSDPTSSLPTSSTTSEVAPSNDVPFWGYILIGVAALAVIGVIVFFVLKKKK